MSGDRAPAGASGPATVPDPTKPSSGSRVREVLIGAGIAAAILLGIPLTGCAIVQAALLAGVPENSALGLASGVGGLLTWVLVAVAIARWMRLGRKARALGAGLFVLVLAALGAGFLIFVT